MRSRADVPAGVDAREHGDADGDDADEVPGLC